jgi:hypothetical protein
MDKIILPLILSLLLELLLVAGQPVFALDKVNVTLPSKSFQFIMFPLAKERGDFVSGQRSKELLGYGGNQRPLHQNQTQDDAWVHARFP